MTIAFTNIGDASLGAGANLSTTYTNAAAGVVVATFSLYGVGGLANIASVTDSTGVTWQRRSRTTMSSAYQPSGITDMGQEVWWAYQPAINASAVTLTIAVANSSLNGLAVHCSQFLVTGSPTPATPWEPGAINTQAYSNGSTPATPNGTVTTAQANSVAFSSLSQMTASGTATDTAATGFTAINNLTTGSTVHFGESAVQKAITSPGTTTITWTGSQLAYLQVNDAFAGVSGVGATVAHVNSASFGGSGTSGTGTIAVTAGNILMLCVHVDSHTSGIPRTPVITDSQSNTWVQTVNSQSAQSGQVQTTDVYYCFPTSTGTLTITATVNTNNSWEAGVDQFSGVDKAFPFSDTPVTKTNYTTTPTAASSTQTVSRAGSYVMAYATTNVFPLTFANPSGFTAGGGSSTGSFASVKGAYIAEAAAGTQTIDYSNATTQTQWCVTSAVLQPPTAIALDGSAIGADSANQTSITATLTTTQTNDVIVVAVLLAGAVARTVSSVTASALRSPSDRARRSQITAATSSSTWRCGTRLRRAP
jgi:hypothetical protein